MMKFKYEKQRTEKEQWFALRNLMFFNKNNLFLFLVLIIVLASFFVFLAFSSDEEDSLPGDFVSSNISTSYTITPKFKVSSHYNLSVYDVMIDDVGQIIDCKSDSTRPLTACIGEKISALNAKDLEYKLSYTFKVPNFLPNADNDYKLFYTFIDKLVSINNYRLQGGNSDMPKGMCEYSCKYDISDRKNMKIQPTKKFEIKYTSENDGTLFEYGNLKAKVDFIVVMQKGTVFSSTDTFDLHKSTYLRKDSSSIVIYQKEFNSGIDLSSNITICGENKKLYNFYATYDSFYGKQYIPFSLDFSVPIPLKVNSFNLDTKKNDENKYVLKWSEVKNKIGFASQSLFGYEIFCSDNNFTNNVNCVTPSVIYPQRFDNSKYIVDKTGGNYEVTVDNCDGEKIISDTNYFFTIVSLNAREDYEYMGTIFNNLTSIDELAPGLSKTYRQEFSVSKSDVKGEIKHEKPTLNEDGTPLSNFSKYMLFFTDKNNEGALNTRLADFTVGKCNYGRFDAQYPLFCYQIEHDKEKTPISDFAQKLSDFNSDPVNLVFYIIPFDDAGNFIKEPNKWIVDHPQ